MKKNAFFSVAGKNAEAWSVPEIFDQSKFMKSNNFSCEASKTISSDFGLFQQNQQTD